MDDFDHIAFSKTMFGVLAARHDLAINLDGYAMLNQTLLSEQVLESAGGRQNERFAVDLDVHLSIVAVAIALAQSLGGWRA